MKEIIEKTYEQRMQICNSCDEFSETKKKNGWKATRIDKHCTLCGCPTESKLRCLSCDCPLAKWKSVMTQDQEMSIKQAIK